MRRSGRIMQIVVQGSILQNMRRGREAKGGYQTRL
jgi:hypothetical protein